MSIGKDFVHICLLNYNAVLCISGYLHGCAKELARYMLLNILTILFVLGVGTVHNQKNRNQALNLVEVVSGLYTGCFICLW